MGLSVEYDHAGCRGTVSWDQPDDPRGLAWSAGTMAAALVFGFAALFLLAGGGMLSQGVGVICGVLAAALAYRAQDPAGSTRTVTARFTVSGGELEVTSPEGTERAYLKGARISAYPDGVFVNPEFGEPIRLMWSAADPIDVEHLAQALRSYRGQSTGLSADVPDALRALSPEG